MYQASKPKSVGKIALPNSPSLSNRVLETLRKTARIVGDTLGPFGRQILIEHQDSNGKPFATKDGVTVFKNIGYEDSIEQVVLEAARDAVVRTAQEAGDGTTTATILSYAIAKYTTEYAKKNKNFPPQRIVRSINAMIPLLETFIKENSYKVGAKNYQEILKKVATLSANGDVKMAELIMEAFDLVGEAGNITISEDYGLPGYEVQKFDGFTVEKGYEESCQNFYSAFVNDQANSRVFLEKPIYILFDGNVIEPNSILFPINLIGANYETNPDTAPKHIIVVAHSFSKNVLAWMAHNFIHGAVKIFPLLTSQTVIQNSQGQLLHDISAFTGATVWNPLARPIQQASFEELCKGTSEAFESTRYRSTVIGLPDPSSVELRVDELKSLMGKAESVRDRLELEVRIAKLTCGIAKVKVIGPSQIEIREKKDRAEDAWCAIRSASKYGALPGGCWTLIHMSKMLRSMMKDVPNQDQAVACEILSNAFLEPVDVLYSNAGYPTNKIEEMVHKMMENPEQTFDLQNDKWVAKSEVLDSSAAVLEAVRNSISISTLLGTLGGVVVFKRDRGMDVSDGKDINQFMKDIEHGDETMEREQFE